MPKLSHKCFKTIFLSNENTDRRVKESCVNVISRSLSPGTKTFFFLKNYFINIKLKECIMHARDLNSHVNLNYEGKIFLIIFYEKLILIQSLRNNVNK